MFPLRDTIPSQRPPVMTVGLIAVNALVFFHELRLSPDQVEAFFYAHGVVPAHYARPPWRSGAGLSLGTLWPFLTSMFMHGGWLHIISNMWILWIFGDNVEDRMGPVRFLAFYVISGLIAAIVHVASARHSAVPIVGASGAIAGVMGAYMLMFPGARVVTMIPIFFYPLFVDIPAFFFLGIWFLSQLVSGTAGLGAAHDVAGIAWWAHVGGFGFGMLFFWLFLRRPKGRRARFADGEA